jgi:6-phosphogluconolactonase
VASPLRTDIHVSEDLEKLSLRAAEIFVSCSGESITSKKNFRAALSGGSTPKRLHALLASEPFRSRVDWRGVEVFFGDERCVPPEHRDSNFGAANEALLSRVPARAHRILGELPPREAALRYEEEVRRAFGFEAGVPSLDLVYLGLGADGHTASLFPGTAALDETERLAVEVYVERLESWRVTLTLPVLNAARKVVFLVSGRAKAEIVREVIAGPDGGYPASLVRPTGGSVLWLLDRAAASLL